MNRWATALTSGFRIPGTEGGFEKPAPEFAIHADRSLLPRSERSPAATVLFHIHEAVRPTD